MTVRNRIRKGFTLVEILIVVVILGGAVVVGGCMYSGYKQAVGLDEQVKSDWAQVENASQSTSATASATVLIRSVSRRDRGSMQ